MVRWLGILFGTLRGSVRARRELALENLALRQQLAVWKARQPRPRLTALDRIFWVVLSRAWKSWRSSLHMVRPENGGGVAPAGVQALLGAEESTPKRSSRDGDGDPRSDSAAEPRQPALGSAEDPWRAAEVRADGIAGDGLKGHAPVAEAAITGVANVFKESRQGSHRVGFLHGAHGDYYYQAA